MRTIALFRMMLCHKISKYAKAGAAFMLIFGVLLAVSYRYHAPVRDTPYIIAKKLSTPLFDRIYREDLVTARLMSGSYFHGSADGEADPETTWKRLGLEVGNLELLRGSGLKALDRRLPFVFDRPGAGYLKELVQRYRLKQLVAGSAPGEYGQMLALFQWLGTRWDHGTTPVPGGALYGSPEDVIAAGERGAKFWCEVSARVTVQAATALGWPARLVTASGDGYHWEHALAEVWSNRFNKWFLVDTDFNVLYEAKGVPLSAYELCHSGPSLKDSGILKVRRIAPLKPSLRYIDLLGFYRYVHIDLRNDWYTRRLHSGSPAGGESATWWTARPDLGQILTSKVRVDDQGQFDWPVNAVEIRGLHLQKLAGGKYLLKVGFYGYSPYFDHFESRVDARDWMQVRVSSAQFYLAEGKHTVEARVVTANGTAGPGYLVEFILHH